MTQQFTANEVRDWERAYKGTGAAKVFGAFADLLEAQEKAVPVMVVNHVSSAEHDLPIGMKLYAHPSPSDAERLAEALRQIAVTTKGYPNASREGEIAIKALAAHSAKAQPPAASVTDEMVMRLKHALPLFCADVTMADARAALEAALAAQENPNG